MSISSISGSQAAVLAGLVGGSGAGGAGAAAGAVDSELIANVEAASGGVSAALQSLSSTLGSIIDVTA